MFRVLSGRICRLYIKQQTASINPHRSIYSIGTCCALREIGFKKCNPSQPECTDPGTKTPLRSNYAHYQINKISKAHNSGNSNSNDQATHGKIKKLIKSSKKKVFVFMKGVPSQPACGYSNAVVQILDAYGVDYDSFDVLSDDEIRQEVKSYSNWPTIPQVYVDGSFVGGCDILIQMHQSNELESLFGLEKAPDDKKSTDGKEDPK